MEDLILAAATYKELLDDSLVGKLFNFTSKNRLKREVTRNCANTGSFVTFPGSLAGEVQLCHLRGYYEPLSKGKLVMYLSW
jgi:hypothetical protein